MSETRSKLQFDGGRIMVKADAAIAVLTGIFQRAGCPAATARLVAEHLVDASLCGVESHGLMRTLQYVEQFASGSMEPAGMPQVGISETGAREINGNGCIGIAAMQLATEEGCRQARQGGLSALAIRHVGHTGRLGAFAEEAALAGCLTIIIGGGNRQNWRQVAPYGGRRGVLPTNPYCIGIPGGDRGPVVLDFATSKIAGGWLYAARSAGGLVPEDCIIDAHGRPTRDPADYFNGGSILSAGGAKGYALSVVAELIGEAMLGPGALEANTLMITLDTTRFREPSQMQAAAEEILTELRECPPAPGFTRVEVPGERERDHRCAANGMIAVPEQTWAQICALVED